MGSNQPSTPSMPSNYCEYVDRCPSRNRSRICVPCLYKNRTGTLKPQLVKVNEDGSFTAKNQLGGYVKSCSCTPVKLCNGCYNHMKDYVFPPVTSKDRLLFLKPYEANNNYAKF
jgi:hypothetical protein